MLSDLKMTFKYDYLTYQGFKDPSTDRSALKDAGYRLRTRSLFWESYLTRDKAEPIYTLQDDEKYGYPSAYQIYMNSIDETDAALKIVGSLRHWRKLLGLKWFMNGIPSYNYDGLVSWRSDMASRDISLAKKVLLDNASRGDTTSAKKLLDEYKGQVKVKRRVGRPTKDEEVNDPKIFLFENKIAELHAKKFGNTNKE